MLKGIPFFWKYTRPQGEDDDGGGVNEGEEESKKKTITGYKEIPGFIGQCTFRGQRESHEKWTGKGDQD